MSECVKCGSEIGTANYCGCGWKRSKATKNEPRQFIQCAHMACNTSAIVKIKTPTGWANFCEPHYGDYYLNQAEETCRKLGLTTTAEKRLWVRGAVKKLVAKWTPDYNRPRDPGDDDEVIAA